MLWYLIYFAFMWIISKSSCLFEISDIIVINNIRSQQLRHKYTTWSLKIFLHGPTISRICCIFIYSTQERKEDVKTMWEQSDICASPLTKSCSCLHLRNADIKVSEQQCNVVVITYFKSSPVWKIIWIAQHKQRWLKPDISWSQYLQLENWFQSP